MTMFAGQKGDVSGERISVTVKLLSRNLFAKS